MRAAIIFAGWIVRFRLFDAKVGVEVGMDAIDGTGAALTWPLICDCGGAAIGGALNRGREGIGARERGRATQAALDRGRAARTYHGIASARPSPIRWLGR